MAEKSEYTASLVEAGVVLMILGAGGWALWFLTLAYAVHRYVPAWLVRRITGGDPK